MDDGLGNEAARAPNGDEEPSLGGEATQGPASAADRSLGDEATGGGAGGKAPELRPGDKVDVYRVIRLLGRGGMGEVYEVEHETLGTRHALKIIPRELARRRGFVERFEREARVMANLAHPGIVHVSDFRVTDGRYWLLMELVKGVPVAQGWVAQASPMPGREAQEDAGGRREGPESDGRLEGGAPSPPRVPSASRAADDERHDGRRPTAERQTAGGDGAPPSKRPTADGDASPTSRAVSLADLAAAYDGKLDQALLADLLTQILEALAYAHERGTVHRDLKPGNILLDEPSEAVSHPSSSLRARGPSGPAAVSIRGHTRRAVVARISDFGLVRLVGEEWVRDQAARSVSTNVSTLGGAATQGRDVSGESTRALLGTYAYMSPEQKTGGDVDARSDLYAVGLLTARLLTGMEELGRLAPTDVDDGLCPAWDGLVTRATDPRPEHRYQTAVDMLADAAAVRDSVAKAKPRRARRRPKAGGARSRAPMFATLAVLILIALGVGGFWVWGNIKHAQTEAARKQRGQAYATAMAEGKGFIGKKDFAKARAAFQRALGVQGYGDDAEAKGMLEACREGAEASRKRIAYEAAFRKTQAAYAKAKGTTDLKRWQEVKRLGEAALATGHGDMSAARKLLAEAGRVLGVTLADMVPAQTHARRLWERVKGLDRAQGFGNLLEQADIVRTNADAFAENKGYADAKYAYDDLAAKCEALQHLEAKRQESKAARSGAEAARKLAVAAEAERRAPNELRAGDARARGAAPLFGSGRFPEAEAKWREASREYARATDLARGHRSAEQARARFEAALGRQDKARLAKWAPAPWRQLNRTAAGAADAAKKRDFAEAVKRYAKAEAEIPVAVKAAESARRADLKRQYDAAMKQGRELLTKEEFGKAETTLRSALKLDGYEQDAEAKRMVAEVPRLADACRKRQRYNLVLSAAKDWHKLAEGRRELKRWEKVKSLAEAAVATGHSDTSEAERLRSTACKALGLPSPEWTYDRKRVKVMTPGGEAWKEITYYKNPLGMEFVKVPAGEFQMGSEKGDSDEKPVHRVRIAKAFYMGAHEVTQREWEQVMGNNPSSFKGPNRPVERVSWNDAQEFIKKLCAKENVANGAYRLSSEAEWEYACRAGSRTPYYWGETWTPSKCMCENDEGSKEDKGVSYYRSHGFPVDSTCDVGKFPPNAFGLYDTSGNVWEWCQDWYDKEYYSKSPPEAPGPGSGSNRVHRGGSWSLSSGCGRSAGRNSDSPVYRYRGLGFRLVRTSK